MVPPTVPSSAETLSLISGKRRRRSRVRSHDISDHPLAPLVVWPPRDGDLGDQRVQCEHPLDRLGPDLLASGVDRLRDPSVDLEAARPRRLLPASPVGSQPPGRNGSAPSLYARSSIGPLTRISPGFATVLRDCDLDPVERDPVVDDPSTGLGHPVRRDDVGGSYLRWRSTAEEDRLERSGVDPRARRRQRATRGSLRTLLRASTAPASNGGGRQGRCP